MSEQSDPVEPTEAPVTAPATPRQKAPRSDAQLAALDAARHKAMKIRQEKAELARKEKVIARATQERDRQERAAKIQADFEALEAIRSTPVEEEEPKKKRKPARRVIHVQEASSASDDEPDEVEVRLPKARPPVRPLTETELRYQKTLNLMFNYQ